MDKIDPSLQTWTVPAPAPGLAERIVANAVKPSGVDLWKGRLKRAVTEWRYGLVYKAAALAACAIIGISIGFGLSQPAYDDTDLEEIAFIVGI